MQFINSFSISVKEVSSIHTSAMSNTAAATSSTYHMMSTISQFAATELSLSSETLTHSQHMSATEVSTTQVIKTSSEYGMSNDGDATLSIPYSTNTMTYSASSIPNLSTAGLSTRILGIKNSDEVSTLSSDMERTSTGQLLQTASETQMNLNSFSSTPQSMSLMSTIHPSIYQSSSNLILSVTDMRRTSTGQLPETTSKTQMNLNLFSSTPQSVSSMFTTHPSIDQSSSSLIPSVTEIHGNSESPTIFSTSIAVSGSRVYQTGEATASSSMIITSSETAITKNTFLPIPQSTITLMDYSSVYKTPSITSLPSIIKQTVVNSTIITPVSESTVQGVQSTVERTSSIQNSVFTMYASTPFPNDIQNSSVRYSSSYMLVKQSTTIPISTIQYHTSPSNFTSETTTYHQISPTSISPINSTESVIHNLYPSSRSTLNNSYSFTTTPPIVTTKTIGFSTHLTSTSLSNTAFPSSNFSSYQIPSPTPLSTTANLLSSNPKHNNTYSSIATPVPTRNLSSLLGTVFVPESSPSIHISVSSTISDNTTASSSLNVTTSRSTQNISSSQASQLASIKPSSLSLTTLTVSSILTGAVSTSSSAPSVNSTLLPSTHSGSKNNSITSTKIQESNQTIRSSFPTNVTKLSLRVINSSTMDISRGNLTSIISTTLVTIRNISTKAIQPTTVLSSTPVTSTVRPTAEQRIMSCNVTIVNRVYTRELSNSSSKEYIEMAKEVKSSVSMILKASLFKEK